MQYIFMLVVLAILFAIALLVRKLIWKEVVLDFFYSKKAADELKAAIKEDYDNSTAEDLAARFLYASVMAILTPRKKKVGERHILYILKLIRQERKGLPLAYDLYDTLISYAISEKAYEHEDRARWSEHIAKDNATLRLNKAAFVAVLDMMIEEVGK